jgi:hypothetical protein
MTLLPRNKSPAPLDVPLLPVAHLVCPGVEAGAVAVPMQAAYRALLAVAFLLISPPDGISGIGDISRRMVFLRDREPGRAHALHLTHQPTTAELKHVPQNPQPSTLNQRQHPARAARPTHYFQRRRDQHRAGCGQTIEVDEARQTKLVIPMHGRVTRERS